MGSSKYTVLITGASGGIGRALALEYAAVGTNIILVSRSKTLLESTGELCRKKGASVCVYCVDLSDITSSVKVSSEIVRLHTVDLLISNAGITNSTQDHRIEDWVKIEEVLSVNLFGALAISHCIIEDMQRRKTGHVAYVSSLGAYYGMPLTPSYSASKAGLKAYTEAIRGLLVKQSVTVTLITPGFVKTSLSDKFPGSKPFMVSPESAARRIKHGLDKKRRVVSFPLALSLGMRFLTLLPAKVSDYILAYLKY